MLSIVWIAIKVRPLFKEKRCKLSCFCYTAVTASASVWLLSFRKVTRFNSLSRKRFFDSYRSFFHVLCLRAHASSILYRTNASTAETSTCQFSQHENCLTCSVQSYPTRQYSDSVLCFHLTNVPIPHSRSLNTFAKCFLVLAFRINFVK